MELFREHMDIAVVREYPTLTLAHIGDCVYELLARSHVVRSGIFKVSDTHMKTVALVSAEAQHKAAEALLCMLDDEETALFMRGRNAKPKTVPKHAALEEYSYATGLETLFGALYLQGNNNRILELWQAALKELEG